VQAYLKELNEVQREAVENIEGPSLVIAGAGSGKTRVLTFRIAHMLYSGKHPLSILALTFTNKAAREMKNRIAKLIGEKAAQYLWMGTFHSIFAKILRMESKAIGYPSSFTIYDAQDSKNLLKSIIKELQLDPNVYKASEVLNRISFSKNNLITAKSYAGNAQIVETDRQLRKPEIARIYQIYENRCKTSAAMDFDDILMKTNYLFDKFPDILKKYQDKFKYILVDEYQDTNYSQYLIIKQLAKIHHNICVVGDDAQSIYSFRGARIENILNFKKDYPENKIFKLEQNYRSTQNIVNAANSVIDKNKNQIKKNVFSEKEPGNKIKIIEAFTDYEEGHILTGIINEIRLSKHFSFNAFAILYRTNAQSRILEEALRKKNIPYQIYGGISFYQRKEIKDLLSYFRLVINPNDDEAFKRIVNYPKRGIGDTSVEKLSSIAIQTQTSMWQTSLRLTESNLGLGAAVQSKILSFMSMIQNFNPAATSVDAYEVARQIAISSGILKDLYIDKSPEGVSRYENVQELLNGIKDYTIREKDENETVTLSQFVENVALLTNEDKNVDDEHERVTLMTIHSAKGLEFKYVFIAGLEEELFPSKFSVSQLSEIEEERRLFYVAITRAESYLCLSYARTRYRWGQLSDCQPSRFIKDINPDFLDFEQQSMQGSPFQSYKQESTNNKEIQKNLNFGKVEKKKFTGFSKKEELYNVKPLEINKSKFSKIENTANPPVVSNISGTLEKLKIGTTVYHDRFGKGKVVMLEGVFPEAKATIEFESSGRKQLLLKFAKLAISS
jgi:DNA helicase-2/ATP-dependent DNA helicase PcrA